MPYPNIGTNCGSRGDRMLKSRAAEILTFTFPATNVHFTQKSSLLIDHFHQQSELS